jgi:hypothetical protein
MKIVKALSASLKDVMTNVERDKYPSSNIEKKAFFDRMMQLVQEFGYFSSIIELDLK